VRRVELRKFACEVERIAKNPLESASIWTTATVSLAFGALLALLGSLAAQSKTNHQPEWLFIVEGTALGAFLLASIFCAWVNYRQKKDKVDQAAILAQQLRACDTRAPQQVSASGDDSSEWAFGTAPEAPAVGASEVA
jgi:hypothetical protein